MAPVRMLPNFLVIGAMKAGTTSLHRYLRSHPDVFMPARKELDFFVGSRNWDRGVGWYERQFAGAGRAAAVGEASPNYTKAHNHPQVPGRVAGTLPGARLVYVVREPIDRIRSMYAHLAGDGTERRPIDRAVLDDPDYVMTSRYAWQLRPYLARYPRDRLMVITTWDLREQRAATIGRVFSFLGVDPAWRPPELDHEAHRTAERRVPRRVAAPLERIGPYWRLLNRSWRLRRAHRLLTTRRARAVATELAPATEAALRERLAPDVAELRELVGSDIDHWDYRPT